MKIKKSPTSVVVFLVVMVVLATAPLLAGASRCEDLIKLTLPNTTITMAESVPAGTFDPPDLPVGPYNAKPMINAPIKGLPAFCRVAGAIKPSAASNVQFEVWMPIEGWTGRYQGVGNGIFWGRVGYSALAAGLLRRNAVSSTDAGHVGGNALWALNNRQLLLDFASGFHYTAQVAKPIITAYYGTAAKYSYFTGCSAGGKQSLWEAQRHPEDYDGYLAGCPAHFESHLNWGHVWNGKAFLNAEGTDIGPGGIPEEKWPMIANAVLAKCDSIDGLVDGLVDNPTGCDFDPSTLLCKVADAANCLTSAQVEAIKKYYAGPVNPRTGEQIFPGYPPGVDPLWYQYLPQGLGIAQFFQGMVFSDMKYNALKSDFDRDVARGDALVAAILDATNPDLTPLKTRGGKIIHWHAWQDQNIAVGSSIDYYEKVLATMGGHDNVQDFYRLFLAPGVRHCGGGDGPNFFVPNVSVPLRDAQHDMLTALEQWVEKGIAPDKIIATKWVNDKREERVQRTRPLCPYPQVARYLGTGSTDDAANFSCRAP